MSEGSGPEESGSDIVRRALAILEEEVRAWLGPTRPTPSADEIAGADE